MYLNLDLISVKILKKIKLKFVFKREREFKA